MKTKLFFDFMLVFLLSISTNALKPVTVVTWTYPESTQKAWDILNNQNRSALDAVEESCTICERMQCRGTVGFGGNPDENGETTLDALIMDGTTMDLGAVGGLRNVKDAVSVARKVMEKTRHSLLGGGLAGDFAEQMGFKKESLQTEKSLGMWKKWKSNNCQPNFWENVKPDPKLHCGPYQSLSGDKASLSPASLSSHVDENNHDTIAVVALDKNGKVAVGVSTNGQKFKIPGRIGDSAVSGAGGYADGEVGAAGATGDGDIIMRFLPSYQSVEFMRQGLSPQAATEASVRRMIKYYPGFRGAVLAMNLAGEFGAACHGLDNFPHYVATPETGGPKYLETPCI